MRRCAHCHYGYQDKDIVSYYEICVKCYEDLRTWDYLMKEKSRA